MTIYRRPDLVIHDEVERSSINSNNVRSMKFEVGDLVKFRDRVAGQGCPSEYRTDGHGDIERELIWHGTTVLSDKYLVEIIPEIIAIRGEWYIVRFPTNSNGMSNQGNGQEGHPGFTQLGFKEEDLILVRKLFMRRTIDKGSTVRVVGKPDVYFDLDDKAEELGATKKWDGKFVPKVGDVGEVLGIDEGYAMVNFEGGEALMDMSCLEPQKKREDVAYLVKFPNNSIEEYSTEKEIEKRMQELYKAQSVKPGDIIKVYDVKGYREIKLKIEVAFI